jgi:hypothetical protein
MGTSVAAREAVGSPAEAPEAAAEMVVAAAIRS